MTPLPEVPNVVRLRHVFTVGADTNVQTSLFLHTPVTGPTAAGLAAFASYAAGVYNTDLAPLAQSSCILTSMEAIDMGNVATPAGIWTGSHPGGSASPPLPANACFLFNYKVARRYRGGHPRGYWPLGVQPSMANQQTWSAGTVSSADTAMASYIAGLLSFPGPPALDKQVAVAFFSHTVPAGHTDDVVAVSLASRIGSQRRRLLGH